MDLSAKNNEHYIFTLMVSTELYAKPNAYLISYLFTQVDNLHNKQFHKRVIFGNLLKNFVLEFLFQSFQFGQVF